MCLFHHDNKRGQWPAIKAAVSITGAAGGDLVQINTVDPRVLVETKNLLIRSRVTLSF